MPGGPTPLGFVYFGGVKFIGYTVAGIVLNWHYNRHVRKPPVMLGLDSGVAIRKRIAYANPLLFGGVRTVLGVLGGFAAFALLAMFDERARFFYAAVLPVRFLEWLLMIWWFYGRPSPGAGRLLACTSVGVLWSCLLDVPAIAAIFVLPSGCWIC